MQFIPIKTKVFRPPQDDLWTLLDSTDIDLQEDDVVFISAKLLAIHQWRCIAQNKIEKKKLVASEADKFYDKDLWPGQWLFLTIKDSVIVPNAGIDESNWDGHYILRPTDIQKFAQELWQYFREKFWLNNLGIVVTDSVPSARRTWVIGKAIGFWGIEPSTSNIWQEDLFGRENIMSQTNIVDTLASMAVLYMWEWNQKTPIVLGRNIEHAKFCEHTDIDAFIFDAKKDFYGPFFSIF